jgi:hypothetical protein
VTTGPGDPGGDGEGTVPARRPPHRRIRPSVLAAVGVLVVLIVVQSLRTHRSSTPLPGGAWGRTIACLQRNTLFTVTDDRGRGEGPVNGHTTAIAVSSSVHRTLLAVAAHYATAAEARKGRSVNVLHAPRSDYRLSGQTVYAWIPGGDPPHLLSDSGERQLITSCVTAPPS